MTRINQFVAKSIGVSRRKADELVDAGHVSINDQPATAGQQVNQGDTVTVDGQKVEPKEVMTIILNKPTGFVSSQRQQGDVPTVYSLLPEELHHLQIVGRLDKESSGLLVLSNDGELSQKLSHPSVGKWKRYYIETSRPLTNEELRSLNLGVEIEDGLSRLRISPITGGYKVELQEGRNRQIRRSIEAVGAKVTKLHRETVGDFTLTGIEEGQWKRVDG